MSDVIIEVAKLLFRLLFEFVFGWTGEIILFLVTFGKRRPRWDLYAEESSGKFVLFSEISVWIGIAFWIAAIYILYRIFS